MINEPHYLAAWAIEFCDPHRVAGLFGGKSCKQPGHTRPSHRALTAGRVIIRRGCGLRHGGTGTKFLP